MIYSRSVILRWSQFMVVIFPCNPTVETFIEKQQNDADVLAAMLQPSSEHAQLNKTARLFFNKSFYRWFSMKYHYQPHGMSSICYHDDSAVCLCVVSLSK